MWLQATIDENDTRALSKKESTASRRKLQEMVEMGREGKPS